MKTAVTASPIARPQIAPGTRSTPTECRLLPLGALCLATSMSAWAQDSATTSAAAGPTLKTVVVKENRDRSTQTYQSGITTVGKAPLAAKDVPQSLTIVNEKLIHDQGADSMKEALRNVPGITFEAGEGGRIGDNIRLRGFSVAGDIYLDGMRDIAQYNRDTFNYDRIEVLRGSASMLFGRGSTGGVVNQVSKQPRAMDETEINATVGTGNYRRLQGEFNIRTGEDAALRINAISTDWNGRAGKAETHRRGLALDYRWGIGTADEFMVSLYHLNYKDRPDLGGRWLEGRPAPLALNKFYGADSDYQKDSADSVSLTHTHRWTDGSTLKTSVRDGIYQRDLWATQINAFAAGTTLANLNGSTVVNRGTQTRAGQEHHTFFQSDYNTQTRWMGLKNEITYGLDVARERANRSGYTGIPARTATTVDAADNTPVVDTRVPFLQTEFASTAVGLYLQDMISLMPTLKAVGGLRWDRFSGTYNRPGGVAPNNTSLARSDAVMSKRLGLMFQPSDEVSYYASYGTSFNTSGDLYQYDNATAKTPPESSRNLEVGAKWELWEGDLSLRTALARTDKYNERNTDVNQATGENLLSGQRHTNSLEFELAGRFNPQWDVFGGVVFMHGVIDQAGSSATAQATVGKNPGLTPSRQANLWTTYKLTDKWRVGGGLTHVSENHPSSANAALLDNTAPAYTKYDALLEYRINEGNTLKANLDNATNKTYYSGLYQAWPSLGAPRSLRVTLTSRF